MGSHSTIGTTFEAFKRACRKDCAQITQNFGKAIAQGDHKGLAIKAVATGVGCYLVGGGVYQIVQGNGEQVPNPEKEDTMQRNWTRMFVGGMTAFTGAATLYLTAVTKLGFSR